MSNDSDNKNLPQVRPNKDIALVSKQLATVNKALTTINREKFIKFLEQDKDAAKFFINHISEHSNVLDMDLIEQHGDQLYWDSLSINKSLPWSEALIERYKDKWDWGENGLSSNESLPWGDPLIERFADKWDWIILSEQRHMVLSESIIDKYSERCDWYKLVFDTENAPDYIFSNENLYWSYDFIVRNEDKINFEGIDDNESILWTNSLIEKYKNIG